MKKIAVRVPQWLGDAVVSTIFLSRLKAQNPESEIHVVCAAYLTPLFKAHSAVHSVMPLEYSAGKNIFQIAKDLKAQQYERIYILPRSLRTALEAWLAKIPERIGYTGDLRGPLLTQAMPYDSHLAYPHRYLKLIKEEQLSLDNLQPFFPKAEMSDDEAGKIIGAPMGNLKRPFLGLAPASVAKARTWDSQRFVEVAQNFLNANGGTVFLFGSSKESGVTASIASKIKGAVVDTGGKLDLLQLGWFLSQMNGFVGNDSGLMHVVSAFDVPAVILFGPSEPKWALPKTGKFKAVQHPEIFCVPCLRNDCVRLGNDYMACMKAITADEVSTILSEVTK